MLRSSLRLLPLWTVALALAAGCSTSSTSDGGTSGSGTSGGSTTGGGSTTTGGGSTSSGGSTSGGSSTGGGDAGPLCGGVPCPVCGGGLHCTPQNPKCDVDGGLCVQCLDNLDCSMSPGRPICVQDDGTALAKFYVHKCKQCQNSADCVTTGNTRGPICDTAGQSEAEGTSFDCGPNCLDGGACSDPTRTVCSTAPNNAGLCVGCQSNTDCTSDPVKVQCDRANGVCVQCLIQFGNGDCTGTRNDAGPTSYCYVDPSGLPSSLSGTCVGCLTVADCHPPDFETTYALEGPTTACNFFDKTCEKACILPKDCRASQVKTSCAVWTTDPGSTFFCGCDPVGTPSGCGGEAPSCFPIPMSMPPLGFCTCFSSAGADLCPTGQVCDPWNYIAGACRPGCVTNNDCADLTHAPFCFPDAGICRECIFDTDCPSSNPVCDPVSLTCRATCTTNADCPPAQPLCNSTGNTNGLCYQCQWLPMAMPPPPTGCPSDKICSGEFFTGSSLLECL